MKNLTLSLSVIAVSTLLTACGGSDNVGGGVTPVVNNNSSAANGNTSSATTTNASNTVSSTAQTSTSSSVATPSNANTRRYGSLLEITNKGIETHAMTPSNINTFAADDVVLDLSFSNSSTGVVKKEINKSDNKYGKTIKMAVSGSDLKDVKYGWLAFLAEKEEDAADILFYQGNQTVRADMPKAGKATYYGHSINACEHCSQGGRVGTVKMEVDFATGGLKGDFTGVGNANSTMTIDGKINGNTFTGQNNAGTKMDGSFFGASGSELAGTYTNEKQEIGGAFGAKK